MWERAFSCFSTQDEEEPKKQGLISTVQQNDSTLTAVLSLSELQTLSPVPAGQSARSEETEKELARLPVVTVLPISI